MLKGDQDKATNYMKVAVELDAKNYKHLQKDPIFMPIRNEVPKPEAIEKKEIEEANKEIETEIKEIEQETNKKQSSKENKVYKHLLKTNILMENLSNKDIMMIKNKKQKQKIQEKQQKEQEQD